MSTHSQNSEAWPPFMTLQPQFSGALPELPPSPPPPESEPLPSTPDVPASMPGAHSQAPKPLPSCAHTWEPAPPLEQVHATEAPGVHALVLGDEGVEQAAMTRSPPQSLMVSRLATLREFAGGPGRRGPPKWSKPPGSGGLRSSVAHAWPPRPHCPGSSVDRARRHF